MQLISMIRFSVSCCDLSPVAVAAEFVISVAGSQLSSRRTSRYAELVVDDISSHVTGLSVSLIDK